jgi:hypothetical protein
MAERRSLIEGIKPSPPTINPDLDRAEKDFVFGDKARAGAAMSPTTPTHTRSPFSTRIRTDFIDALKRASLERQLGKVEPHTLVDILEQAIEPWLKSNGYLS